MTHPKEFKVEAILPDDVSVDHVKGYLLRAFPSEAFEPKSEPDRLPGHVKWSFHGVLLSMEEFNMLKMEQFKQGVQLARQIAGGQP